MLVWCSSSVVLITLSYFFFFNDTATTEIYTLSLHDALPISKPVILKFRRGWISRSSLIGTKALRRARGRPQRKTECLRSEEHTSELQSPCNLACRLLLEKKKKIIIVSVYHIVFISSTDTRGY